MQEHGRCQCQSWHAKEVATLRIEKQAQHIVARVTGVCVCWCVNVNNNDDDGDPVDDDANNNDDDDDDECDVMVAGRTRSNPGALGSVIKAELFAAAAAAAASLLCCGCWDTMEDLSTIQLCGRCT